VAVGRDVRRLPFAETTDGPQPGCRILNDPPASNEKQGADRPAIHSLLLTSFVSRQAQFRFRRVL
jgi:hypothetical protein